MRKTQNRYSQGVGLFSICQMRSINDVLVRFNTLAVSVKLLKSSEACGSSHSLLVVSRSTVQGATGRQDWLHSKQQLVPPRLGHVEMQATDAIKGDLHSIQYTPLRTSQHITDTLTTLLPKCSRLLTFIRLSNHVHVDFGR